MIFSHCFSYRRLPLKSVEDNKRPTTGNNGQQKASKEKEKSHSAGKNKKIWLPKMEFMTVEEFDGVPK